MDNEKADDEKPKVSESPSGDGDQTASSGNNDTGDVSPRNAAPQNQYPDNQYFVSYSRTEYYFTRELVAQLRRHGLDIWFDQQELLPGLEWKSEINSGLENCVGLILVVSRASLQSANVAYEWQSAMRQNKPVYLVLSEAVDIKKIELKSDDIDVTQYSHEDLVRYARKIIDMRRGADKATSLLVKHILEGKEIRGRTTIPKPGVLGLQLAAPKTVWSIGLTFILIALYQIYEGILLARQFFREPNFYDALFSIISFTFAFLMLIQSRRFLARDEFSMFEMRWLLPLSFVAFVLSVAGLYDPSVPYSVETLNNPETLFAYAGFLLTLLGFYTFYRLTYLRGSLLQWLRRFAVETTILSQPEVEKTVETHIRNLVPELGSVVGSMNTLLLQFRQSEPPLPLIKADQKKAPPTYDLLHVEADSRLARKIEKALKRYKMKRVDKTASDMTIVIITNHSNEAFSQDVQATKNKLVIILATSIVSNHYFEELQKLQWFDYRTHNDLDLYDLARTIFSQEYSYLRGLPPSVGTIIVPNGVKRTVALIHLIGSLNILGGGYLAAAAVEAVLTQKAALPVAVMLALLMLLFGGLSIWTGWRIIVETGNILNRRLSRYRQGARLSVSFLPAIAAAVLVVVFWESFLIAQVGSGFFSLVIGLPLSASVLMLLAFTLAMMSNLGIWFPAQTLAKDDQSGILFSTKDIRRKGRPFLYGSTACVILLWIATLVGGTNAR